jgi:tetratricopeptide (TPR) repeat protein
MLVSWLAFTNVGCRRAQPLQGTGSATASADAAVSVRPRGLPPAVVTLDAEIAALERVAAGRSDDWLDLEQVASRYLQRAALTADYQDYAHAEDALNRAFQRAASTPGTGPYLLRAQLNYTLHRLDRVTSDLDAIGRFVLTPPSVRDAAKELRANVAFYSGNYDAARTAYEQIVQDDRSLENVVALALYRWKTGDFARAEELLSDAATVGATRDANVRGWLCLVRGLYALDRGRWDEALTHYRAGLVLRPGYWLLQEHEAEILTLQGHADQTLPVYLDLIERTNNPEFMDAVAAIYRRQGNPTVAAAWVLRARTIYDARLRQFPEAVAGHAVEHFLEHDPARAVGIAEANVRARPGGEAQVHLARAYLKVGRVAEAKTVIERTLATPWNTAELHAAASAIYTATGDTARSAEQRRLALAINPHAFDE